MPSFYVDNELLTYKIQAATRLDFEGYPNLSCLIKYPSICSST